MGLLYRCLLNECYITHTIRYSWVWYLICSEHFSLTIWLSSVFFISCVFMSTAKVFHTCYPHIVQMDQSRNRVHLTREMLYVTIFHINIHSYIEIMYKCSKQAVKSGALRQQIVLYKKSILGYWTNLFLHIKPRPNSIYKKNPRYFKVFDCHCLTLLCWVRSLETCSVKH